MTTSPHTGILERDAPGCFARLKKRYPECIDALADCYRKAAECGAFYEHGILRVEGASFNPRPARIVTLLLQHCDPGPVDIQLALLSCASTDQIIHESDVLAKRAAEIQRAENISTLEHIEKAIVLISVLDRIRHLHMSLESIQIHEHEINRARSILSELHDAENLEDLCRLISAACARYERYHGTESSFSHE